MEGSQNIDHRYDDQASEIIDDHQSTIGHPDDATGHPGDEAAQEEAVADSIVQEAVASPAD